MLRITQLAHQLLTGVIFEGDTVIDATCGNGNDTLFLAKQVGESGRVHAYDIQPEALSATQERLMAHGLHHRVHLHLASHETIAQEATPVKAVVFNLGYRPGGDKSITTHPASTIRALQAALKRLLPGGMILIAVYPAHPGGEDEAQAVCDWVKQLSLKQFTAVQMTNILAAQNAPFLIAIEKHLKH